MAQTICTEAEAAAVIGGGTRLPESSIGCTGFWAVEDLDDGLALRIESVPERLDLERRLLADAESRAPRLPPTPVRCPSTSWPADLQRPEFFLGLHFFNPVWSLGLIEVVRGARTGEQTLTGALDWAQRLVDAQR